MIGVPEPTMSLLDRVRQRQPPTAPMGQSDTGRTQPATPPSVSSGVPDAGRTIDSGGMAAAGFGTSPIAQSPGGQLPSKPQGLARRRSMYDV
jgi:hypothetical protein